MELQYIEIEKIADKLEAFYINQFTKVFGEKPVQLETEDRNTLRWLVNQYKEEKKCIGFIQCYLSHDDEWVKSHGYPIRLLKRTLQALIVKNSSREQDDLPVYVLNYTESGKPVCHTALKQIGNFKPVLWEEWINQSIEEKLQYTKEAWEIVGNDIDSWVELWKKEGWLINNNITHNPMGKIPKIVKDRIKENKTKEDYAPNPDLSAFCIKIIQGCVDGTINKEQHEEAMSVIDKMVNRNQG